MVATIDVKEGNGASVSWTIVTTPRFCTEDNNNPGTTNPIPIPDADYNYSFWKNFTLAISGSFTLINNVRHYCDGTIGWSLGTNGEVRRGNRDSGDHGCPEGSYEQALGTVGTTGYTIEDITNGHDYYNGQTTKTTNIESDTSSLPADIDTTDHTSAENTKHIVLQVKVATNATRGAKTPEEFTWLYDEI